MIIDKLWLTALLVCILGGCLSSCKDDGKESSEQEKEQQAEQDLDQAAEFWSVVGQLTDDVMPEDWRNATYEPTIGEPDGANASVRIVSCPDAESAAAHFADLVGLTLGGSFAASNSDYTYTSPVVGTLRYQLTGGQSLAVVDVDIKQMPGLSQIVYKSPEQLQENGSFNGTAYYRFGDVVSKYNADGQMDYWICVRPCFGPESKGDSHWMTLSKLPSANVKTAAKRVNGVQLNHIMPKSLCANQTHMQNLAELLYAMTNPDTWAENLRNGYTKLKFFTDFNYKRSYQFNNQYFFEKVGNAWPEELYLQIFGLTKEQLGQELSQNGLNLIYNTTTMSGNNITLPVASFSGTNLKTKVLTKKTSAWTTESFNIYDMTKKGYAEFTNFAGGKEKAWVARYATGATLAKGSQENPVFNKYKRLPNCRDVFVYNADVDNLNLDNLQNIAPKEAVSGSEAPTASNALTDGSGTYMIGDVVKDEDGNRWICIAGSPRTMFAPNVTERAATFITFDFNGVDVNNYKAGGLPDNEEIIELAARLIGFYSSITTCKSPYQFDPSRGIMGSILKHVLTYAEVDMVNKAIVNVDSCWTFKSKGETYDSYSNSFLMNIAYDDGSNNKQAVLRLILDCTLTGSHRSTCLAESGEHWDTWKYLMYKHYQTFDLTKMRPLTSDEVGFGMNRWCQPWAMTADKMYLQDVNDAQMVSKYAADDKWVRLPLNDYVSNHLGQRRTPRTTTETARPVDYIGKYDIGDKPKTNIFNEPVMFLRMMKVTDNGGHSPNLTSQDGRHLTVVHLQNDRILYSSAVQGSWSLQYNEFERNNSFFLDNDLIILSATAGW